LELLQQYGQKWRGRKNKTENPCDEEKGRGKKRRRLEEEEAARRFSPKPGVVHCTSKYREMYIYL
jgi:hypothetical protein